MKCSARFALVAVKNSRMGKMRTVFGLPNKIDEYRKPFVANPHLVGALLVYTMCSEHLALAGADNPTWLKAGKSDEAVAWAGEPINIITPQQTHGSGFAICGAALMMIGRGLYCMATGTGKLE